MRRSPIACHTVSAILWVTCACMQAEGPPGSVDPVVAGTATEPASGKADGLGVRREKIVRGQPTTSASGVLRILRSDGMTCTASLIGDRVAITARHCIDQGPYQAVVEPSIVFVGAGLYGGDHLTRVREILTTPGRDPYTGAGDFAVLVLEASMAITALGFVDAATTTPPRRGTLLTAVGYGLTDIRNQDSGVK